ncbi:MAG: ABC transporter substrate-binding protein [Longilinea sp.]|nr:ABC transporter substrate-binding protein [Longilinea sp.]
MQRKSLFVVLAIILIASMALTACTPKPDETNAEPVVFVFGRGADSVQLDPSIVTDGESFRVTGQVLEPLYQYEPGSTKPIPALAEECTPNEDATVWTCKLRKGVKFHDGTDFNADAVIFNFERWRFTTHPNHYASQVFEYYEAMWGGFDDASIITEVKKIDDYTVEFDLSDPLAPFLANLAMDMFAISSPAAIQAAGESYGTPTGGCVGTGPFKFVEWVEGDHIIVEKNVDYWGGAPKIDQILFRVIPDDSARFLALKAGDIQGMEQAVVEDLTAAANDPNLYIMTRPALNTSYLAFNFKIKEFQDVRVREAVAHAIDKEGLIKNFFGDYGTVATNLLPPLVWGHNDAVEDWAYDPELSRQLLAEAGFPDGLSEVTIAEDIMDADGNVVYKAGDVIPLRLYYMPVTRFYFPAAKEIGEAAAANLVAAGFNVELYLEGDWPTYLGSRRNGLLVGLYFLGWGGDNGDPDNFTGYFFGSGTEPIKREGWYQNAELAELLQEAAITPDYATREALYKQAEQMMHDDVTRVWLGHNNTPLIFLKSIKGYVPQPVGADYFEFVEIVP